MHFKQQQYFSIQFFWKSISSELNPSYISVHIYANFILYSFPFMNYSDVTSLLRNLLSRTRTPKWLMIFTRYVHIRMKKGRTEKRWRLVWYPTWFGAFIRPLHQAISRIKTPYVRCDKPRQPALWKLMTSKFYGLRKRNCFRKLSPMC